MIDDWRERLIGRFEAALSAEDPRPRISAYHNMPFAIFRYPATVEFALRKEVAMLKTRLEQTAAKRVTTISLADCLTEALDAEGLSSREIGEAEKQVGLQTTVETIHQILAEEQPLDDLVVAQVPRHADPLTDVIFIVRTGALFPVYRTSSLLEHLKGRIEVPTVLFYPGDLDGAAGLRFMGVLAAEHNYRPKIF